MERTAERCSHVTTPRRSTKVDIGDLEPSFDLALLAVSDPNGIPQDEYQCV